MKMFLSAVSGQFRDCRDALASDLRAVRVEVTVQEDFQQQGRTLLEELEAYIAGCDRVIALVGDADAYEPEAAGRPAGRPRRSYSQWEDAFARGGRLDGSTAPPKDIYVYVTTDDYLKAHPVKQAAVRARLQRGFLAAIRASGKDRNAFGLLHELCRLALHDGFQVPDLDRDDQAQQPAAGLDRHALLQDTHRLDEAAPLFRRVVRIRIEFERRNGFEHSRIRESLAIYQDTLQAMGKTSEEIEQHVRELIEPPRPEDS